MNKIAFKLILGDHIKKSILESKQNNNGYILLKRFNK